TLILFLVIITLFFINTVFGVAPTVHTDNQFSIDRGLGSEVFIQEDSCVDTGGDFYDCTLSNYADCSYDGQYRARFYTGAEYSPSYANMYFVNRDNVQADCECSGNTWVAGATYCGSTGCTGGKCCGDDGVNDDFCIGINYQSCSDGNIITDADANLFTCETCGSGTWDSYNTRCCGDDGAGDDFCFEPGIYEACVAGVYSNDRQGQQDVCECGGGIWTGSSCYDCIEESDSGKNQCEECGDQYWTGTACCGDDGGFDNDPDCVPYSIGLKMFDGTNIINISPDFTKKSPLKIAKENVIIGVGLVPQTDLYASNMRIQAPLLLETTPITSTVLLYHMELLRLEPDSDTVLLMNFDGDNIEPTQADETTELIMHFEGEDVPLSEDMLLYYHLNKDSDYGENNTYFYDFSRNQNHGGCSGAACPTFLDNFGFDGGFSFDGADNINAGDLDEMDAASELTISYWARIDIVDSIWRSYHYKGAGSGDRNSIQEYNGGLYVLLSSGGVNTYGYTSPAVVSEGLFYHVVMVFNGSKATNAERLKLYLNGQEQTLSYSGTIPSATDDNSNAFTLGNNMIGVMDELIIFTKALSQTEVEEIYAIRKAPLYDSSGNENNGSCTGTSCPAYTSDGKIGGAYSFDGVNDYVSTPLMIDQSGAGTAATFCAWVYPTSTSGGEHQLISTDSGGFDWGILREGGTWYVFTGAGSDDTRDPVDLNSWQHICGVFGTTLLPGTKVYKNGVEIYTTTDYGYNVGTNPITIGMNPGNSAEYFAGLIDEVLIYDYPLSAEEINEVYKRGTDFYDSSSSENHGEYWLGDQTNKVEYGKIGGSYIFDGIDDYISLGKEELDNLYLPLSISAWIRPEVSKDQGIFSSDMGTGSISDNYYGFWMLLNSENKITLNYGDGSGTRSSTIRSYDGVSDVIIGEWNHVVGVIRGAQDMDIYINGELDPSTIYSGDGGAMVHTTDFDARIGMWKHRLTLGEDTDMFQGEMDEVAIYNRSLSEKEVKEMYAKGIGAYDMSGRQTEIVPYSDALALYHMNNDWLDSSTPTYNGTSTGATFTTNSVFGSHAGDFSLSGSDYVTLSGTTSSLNVYNDFTFSFWVNIQGSTTRNAIYSKPYNLWIRSQLTNTIGIESGASPWAAIEINFSDALNSNEWYHVAITHNTADTTKIYINGILKKEGTLDIPSSTANLAYLGGWSGSSHNFNGYIDEFAVFNRELTEKEIQEIHLNRAGSCSGATCPAYNTNYKKLGSGAMDFDADNLQGIYAPDNILNNLNEGAVSMWVKPKNTGLSYTIFHYTKLTHTSQYVQLVIDSTGIIAFYVRGGAPCTAGWWIQQQTTGKINWDKWNHVVVNQDGVHPEIYINGINQTLINPGGYGCRLDAFFDDVVAASPGDYSPIIGLFNRSSGPLTPFNGSVDEVVIYDEALSEEEIKELYRGKIDTYALRSLTPT
ncbi:LamG domain-containing protein, partial [Candidatus Woesearchaeota archaeon]|nr:LamG domain-containing protein [Candidatus Woesearchaeota archaeon]